MTSIAAPQRRKPVLRSVDLLRPCAHPRRTNVPLVWQARRLPYVALRLNPGGIQERTGRSIITLRSILFSMLAILFVVTSRSPGQAAQTDAADQAQESKTAYEPGDRVVLRMTGRLTIPGKVVGELRKGVVVEVLHVKDEWVWVRSGKAGWLQDKYVIPLREGVAFFTGEIGRNAKDGVAYESRGHVYRNLGDYEKAIRDYDMAIRLNPKNTFAIKNWAFANFQQGEYATAIKGYNRVLQLNPKDAGAWNDRGHNYYQLKQYPQALADYEAALRLDPEHLTAMNNRAWLLSTCPVDKLRNGRQAVASARKACELAKPANYDYVDTLAAAYAEAGYFDLAVKVAGDAIRLAPAEQKPPIQRRLALYRQKSPFHEPAD